MNFNFPESYHSVLDKRKTVELVQAIIDFYGQAFSEKLNLQKVKAPLIYRASSGLSDNLREKIATVRFDFDDFNGEQLEVVRAVTKWKRLFLKDAGFKHGEGIYTEAVGVRPDEELSNIHSIYVDQWDWELIISDRQYNLDFLKTIVKKIYQALVETEKYTVEKVPEILPVLPDNLVFVHSSELAGSNLKSDAEKLEYEFVKKHKAVFVIGIGGKTTAKYYADRAADYDDWVTLSDTGLPGLNGDLLVWNPVLKKPLELASLGIRVAKEALIKQVEIMNCRQVLDFPWHKQLLNNQLPLTIGGGTGISRTCMFLLRKAHIGEVQPGVWSDEMIAACEAANIHLL